MTRLCIFAFVLPLSSGMALAQNSDQLFTATKQQLDVAKVVLAQEDAWNKGDLNAYLAFYKDAPDTEAILEGPVHGMAGIRATMHASFPTSASMGTLEQTDVTVRALGDDHALAIGKYHLNRPKKNGGEAQGSFTEVLEKTPAGWRVVFSQNT